MSMWEIGGALLGGLFGGDDEEQTQTQERSPWAPAQPWIQQNIQSGQHLQDYYQQNPLSPEQRAAFGNQRQMTDNFRNVAGSLSQQMSSQRPFDRSNPLGRVDPFNFGMTGTGSMTPGGSGGSGGGAGPSNPFQPGWRPAAPLPVAPGVGGQPGEMSGPGDPSGTGGMGGSGGGFVDPFGSMGGLGMYGGGATGYSQGMNGVMNGPIGIGIGTVANALGIGGAAVPGGAPVSDAYGRSVADVQAEAAAREAAAQAARAQELAAARNAAEGAAASTAGAAAAAGAATAAARASASAAMRASASATRGSPAALMARSRRSRHSSRCATPAPCPPSRMIRHLRQLAV